jgi:hypothetical protein
VAAVGDRDAVCDGGAAGLLALQQRLDERATIDARMGGGDRRYQGGEDLALAVAGDVQLHALGV